jgi:hypothetical protein
MDFESFLCVTFLMASYNFYQPRYATKLDINACIHAYDMTTLRERGRDQLDASQSK